MSQFTEPYDITAGRWNQSNYYNYAFAQMQYLKSS